MSHFEEFYFILKADDIVRPIVSNFYPSIFTLVRSNTANPIIGTVVTTRYQIRIVLEDTEITSQQLSDAYVCAFDHT
jgi:hypothetical protein